MKNRIIFFFSMSIFISLSSCCQHLYFGLYERTGTNEKFKVLSDSTFEYSLVSGYDKSYSSGKWFLEKGKNNVLFLKSFYSKDNYPFFVEEESEIGRSVIEVRISEFFARSKDTVLWMSLILNDSLIIEVKNSVIKVPIKMGELRKIQLIFYYNNFLKPDLTLIQENTKQFKTKVFNVGHSGANIFIISYPKIDLKMFDFYEFNNEKILISNKQLDWVQKNRIFKLK